MINNPSSVFLNIVARTRDMNMSAENNMLFKAVSMLLFQNANLEFLSRVFRVIF